MKVADNAGAELGGLISPRASQDRRLDPEKREELWKASVRPYNALRREKMRAAGEREVPPGPARAPQSHSRGSESPLRRRGGKVVGRSTERSLG